MEKSKILKNFIKKIKKKWKKLKILKKKNI
jgi:hypothetical protein